MATHSSILAWKIPWTEEPGGLQSMVSQRGRQDWATSLTHSFSLVNVLICEISVSRARECPWSSLRWSRSGLSSAICLGHLSFPFLSICMHFWSLLKCRCTEAGRVEKVAVPVGVVLLQCLQILAHMRGDHIIYFLTRDTVESVLFIKTKTAGVNFSCPEKTQMNAHLCHVAVWAPKFARSVDFSRRTKNLIFYVKAPNFKLLLFFRKILSGLN